MGWVAAGLGLTIPASSKLTGTDMILSVHAVQAPPRWISTDRHVMQGYVDLVKKPQWEDSTGVPHAPLSLNGTSHWIIFLARVGDSNG